MRLKLSYFMLLIALIFAGPVKLSAQKTKENSDLKTWPKGCSPQEVGKRMLNTLLSVLCLMHQKDHLS